MSASDPNCGGIDAGIRLLVQDLVKRGFTVDAAFDALERTCGSHLRDIDLAWSVTVDADGKVWLDHPDGAAALRRLARGDGYLVDLYEPDGTWITSGGLAPFKSGEVFDVFDCPTWPPRPGADVVAVVS